jgi:arginyl-tRNA synthetase
LTYLVPDIAYHIDKHDRGFDRAIDVWGADHHGYIPRMKAVLLALGYPADFFGVELVQLVKVMREGEEVKMSKRSGEFVTLRDLVEEVGVDAARYFFRCGGVTLRSSSTLTSPPGRPTRTRSSTSRWRMPG